jgi:hypothetical protein
MLQRVFTEHRRATPCIKVGSRSLDIYDNVLTRHALNGRVLH